MPPPLGAGGIIFSGCPSVRPSVRPKPEIPSFDLYMSPLVYPTNRNRFAACPSVRPSVRPERFPGICRRTHGGNGLKFYMLIYLDHLQNWLVYIIALRWWFCPCRVGGAVWNHTAWLFPLMPLPTLSLFYSYFLSGNKYRKNITCKNIGQFQFCINLLPLELIWRSASCPRHWNQRWFGDAAFTIPSGKQWDHMSPWPPGWLSAGIDECCRSANESGHQWLKNSWLETIWH